MSGNDIEMVSMEEGRTKRIGIQDQARETCIESSQTIIEDRELSDNAKKNLKSLDDLLIDEAPPKPRIPKVADVMRNNQNLKKYFEPRVVSIGPYHQEKKNLRVTEEMKLKLAALFIKEHGVNKEDLYLQILREIGDLRKYYELDATQHYNDDDLAWMFLIDGCVVLLYVYSFKFSRREFNESRGLEIIKGIPEDIKFTMDLLLLENQLPYRVLKLLVIASNNSELVEISIEYFIAKVSHIDELKDKVEIPAEEPSHLLDLMRASLIKSPKESSSELGRLKRFTNKYIEMLSAILRYLIFVLLHFIPFSHTFNTWPACRNIVELKEAGIKLKPSGSYYLTDISFSGGTLKLPSILMNKLTAFKFLNLVAHELSLNSCSNFEVSAYLYLLATLIVGVEDVKELRVNNILVNYNLNDKEVVKLFEEIKVNDEMFAMFAVENYESMREEIHDYCQKSCNAWMAQLKNKYFESPWSVIGLAGAIIALSMSILQTIYTILAYYGEGSAAAPSSLPSSTSVT